MTTPNLNLPQMPQNTFQPSVDFNSAMQIIDALLGLAPLDKDLNIPPTTTAGDAGKTWIVGLTPTGAWAGQTNKIAVCTGANLWTFLNPKNGLLARVQDEAKFYFYDGAIWTLLTV